MPKSEWTNWRQVAETFIIERPVRNPDLAVDVLTGALSDARSWGDLFGGTWMLMSANFIYMADYPGYAAGRMYQLIDRLADWLHGRGDIDDWQHDVMLAETDACRKACGRPTRREGGVTEFILHGFERAHVAEKFARVLGGSERRGAAAVLDTIRAQINAKLGEGGGVPFGCLDVDDLVADLLGPSAGLDGPEREFFSLAARLYRWLGETGQLDPSRATWIASRLGAAALGAAA